MRLRRPRFNRVDRVNTAGLKLHGSSFVEASADYGPEERGNGFARELIKNFLHEVLISGDIYSKGARALHFFYFSETRNVEIDGDTIWRFKRGEGERERGGGMEKEREMGMERGETVGEGREREGREGDGERG